MPKTREEIEQEADYLERRDIDFLFEEMVLYYDKPSLFKSVCCSLGLHGSTKHLRFDREEFIRRKSSRYGYGRYDSDESHYICTSCKEEWVRQKRDKGFY